MEKKEALKIMGYPIAGGVIGGTVKVFLSNYGPWKNPGEVVTGLLAATVTVGLILTLLVLEKCQRRPREGV